MRARRALPPRQLNEPRPGLYKLQLVKGGVWVPAIIRHAPPYDRLTCRQLDRSWLWSAQLGTQPAKSAAPRPNDDVWHVHERGVPIALDEYRYLVRLARWAARVPGAPEHDPKQPIDLTTQPTLF